MADKYMQPVFMEDVRVLFRNFSGKEGQYTRAGDRNFCVLLDDDLAQGMERDGWNVKYLKPREEDEAPKPYLQVAVSYKLRPPNVVMVTSRGRTSLGETELDILDWVDVKKVDLSLNPSRWEVNGKTGVKAYLRSFFITIVEDELELKYADVPDVPDSAQNTIGAKFEEFE